MLYLGVLYILEDGSRGGIGAEMGSRLEEGPRVKATSGEAPVAGTLPQGIVEERRKGHKPCRTWPRAQRALVNRGGGGAMEMSLGRKKRQALFYGQRSPMGEIRGHGGW